MAADLIDLVQHLGQPHVLVLGDLMLDRYVWGDAERISQEAPVILLHADKREERLGGASSVATMLRALGAKVSIVGVVGADFDGARIRQSLTDPGIDHDGVVNDAGRPSTVKERYIGRAAHRHPQQLLRVDFETRQPVTDGVETALAEAVQHQLRRADIVLISDYDKGVCTPGLLASAIAAARSLGLRILADCFAPLDFVISVSGKSGKTKLKMELGSSLASAPRETRPVQRRTKGTRAHAHFTLDRHRPGFFCVFRRMVKSSRLTTNIAIAAGNARSAARVASQFSRTVRLPSGTGAAAR